MPSRSRVRAAAALGVLGVVSILAARPVAAEPFRLAPNTKVQISIVQWNPAKGEYQRWDALGGTFVVSPDATLSLPVLGSIDVAGQSGADVAERIASALQEKVGLISPPEVTVEVAEYPPIYVVGSVTQPGQYSYRPELTVLQALALGGGRYRAVAPGGKDVLSLAGEVEVLRADELRLIGRIARLEAEFTGASEISFPPQLTSNPNRTLVDEIVNLEQAVFAARVEETNRQLQTLSDLHDLYGQELDTLTARAQAGDRSVALAEKQLQGVTELYQKGVATLSRQADLERVVAELQVERLVDDTEMMKVRQNIQRNRRDELSIHDQRQTGLAIELRDARAELDRLRSRRVTVESLLMEASGGAAPIDATDEEELVFEIIRNDNGTVVSLQASESTFLEPGDVVKVKPAGRASHTAPVASSGSSPEHLSSAQPVPIPIVKPQPPGKS